MQMSGATASKMGDGHGPHTSLLPWSSGHAAAAPSADPAAAAWVETRNPGTVLIPHLWDRYTLTRRTSLPLGRRHTASLDTLRAYSCRWLAAVCSGAWRQQALGTGPACAWSGAGEGVQVQLQMIGRGLWPEAGCWGRVPR